MFRKVSCDTFRGCRRFLRKTAGKHFSARNLRSHWKNEGMQIFSRKMGFFFANLLLEAYTPLLLIVMGALPPCPHEVSER